MTSSTCTPRVEMTTASSLRHRCLATRERADLPSSCASSADRAAGIVTGLREDCEVRIGRYVGSGFLPAAGQKVVQNTALGNKPVVRCGLFGSLIRMRGVPQFETFPGRNTRAPATGHCQAHKERQSKLYDLSLEILRGSRWQFRVLRELKGREPQAIVRASAAMCRRLAVDVDRDIRCLHDREHEPGAESPDCSQEQSVEIGEHVDRTSETTARTDQLGRPRPRGLQSTTCGRTRIRTILPPARQTRTNGARRSDIRLQSRFSPYMAVP